MPLPLRPVQAASRVFPGQFTFYSQLQDDSEPLTSPSRDNFLGIKPTSLFRQLKLDLPGIEPTSLPSQGHIVELTSPVVNSWFNIPTCDMTCHVTGDYFLFYSLGIIFYFTASSTVTASLCGGVTAKS